MLSTVDKFENTLAWTAKTELFENANAKSHGRPCSKSSSDVRQRFSADGEHCIRFRVKPSRLSLDGEHFISFQIDLD